MHASATSTCALHASPALPKARDMGAQQSYTLNELQASQFFLDCMGNGGNVPSLAESRRQPEADGVLRALKAMASPEELAVLSSKERDTALQAHAVRIASTVVRHLVQRLLRSYADKGDTKGAGRLATCTVLVNTLDRHLKVTKLDVSGSAFAKWRNDPSAQIVGGLASMLGPSRNGSKRPIEPSDGPIELSDDDEPHFSGSQ